MTMAVHHSRTFSVGLPNWVPDGALHYLAHTELGEPIRALARAAGCHASTVLRQIRRIETRRDDPLVDAALRRLGAMQKAQDAGTAQKERAALPDVQTLRQESMRVLRRLCETGALLAVAAEMEKAVVVRDTATGGSTRTAVVSTTIAQAMALQEWIAPANTGRIVRYQITAAGRTALEEMLEDPELSHLDPGGFADASTPFVGKDDAETVEFEGPEDNKASRRIRYALAESPLAALARRKDRKGTPFLDDRLVAAGERLREDFELAQMRSRTAQDWDRMITAGPKALSEAGETPAPNDAPSEARARVAAALSDLGPGLSDVVLRCCCYLEGLETAERRLGWSARSGKVVLRIALMRLQRHYEQTIGPGGPMIG